MRYDRPDQRMTSADRQHLVQSMRSAIDRLQQTDPESIELHILRQMMPDHDQPGAVPNRRYPMEPTSKPIYQSKTVIAAALVAVLPLIPGVGPVASAWVAANPAAFSAILGAVFAGLRAITKDGVHFS